MSDQDPRIRELTYRLMAMAPDAPPFPEETVMKASNTKQRSPAMVWVAAALAVVLLVGVPLLLFRGSDEVPTTIAATDTTTTDTTTTTSGVVTTSAAVGTTLTIPGLELLPVSTSGDCGQDWRELEPRDVYTIYVFFGCDRPGMENVLVPRPRAVRDPVDYDPFDAFVLQFTGPTDEERAAGYVAFTIEDDGVLSPKTAVVGASWPNDAEVRFADFSSNPGMLNASASAASSQLLAQLSSVALQFPGFDSITFSFDRDCDAFWNWLQRDCTAISRSDWRNGDLTSGVAEWWNLLSSPTATTSSEGEPPTTTEAVTSDTILPGDPFDIGPASGDVIAVVGVAHDDVLWLRDGPGTGYEPLLGLDPLADNLVATGRHRLLTSSIWDEVTVDGVTGWVNSSYVGYLGYTEDLTTVVEDRVGAALETETMQQMGQIVAEAMASADEGGSRIVTSVAPSVGDLGEITMDVWGLADDAQLGWRLHIFATPSASGEGFVLKSVEATGICGRGVTADGWCI